MVSIQDTEIALRKIVDRLKIDDTPSLCPCGQARECNGWLNSERGARPCAGIVQRDIDTIAERFLSAIPVKYDIKGHQDRPEQAKMAAAMSMGGAWVYGPSRKGKSHLVYRTIYLQLKKAKQIQTHYTVKADTLLKSWVDQYGDHETRRGARNVEIMLKTANIVFIDDIDKTGQMSEAREQSFFSLIDFIDENKSLIYITSQLSIHDFCQRFPNEKRVHQRDGCGPIENRIKNLCREVAI